MRNYRFLLAAIVLAAGLLLVVPGEAQQLGSFSGAGAGQKPGSIVGGFMPTNIVSKPVDISGAVKPVNFQSTMQPQQQSTKVFNVNSAIHKMDIPYFRSTVPSTPVIKPGKGNPLQPQKAVALPPVKVPPTRLLGFIPWY